MVQVRVLGTEQLPVQGLGPIEFYHGAPEAQREVDLTEKSHSKWQAPAAPTVRPLDTGSDPASL